MYKNIRLTSKTLFLLLNTNFGFSHFDFKGESETFIQAGFTPSYSCVHVTLLFTWSHDIYCSPGHMTSIVHLVT